MSSRRSFAGLPAGVLIALATMVPTFHAASAETTETLQDGTRCSVITGQKDSGSGVSTRVTAGGGTVSSSTSIGNAGNTGQTASSGATASSSSSSTGSAQAMSSTSMTRPDGSIVTRSSDGSCVITRPAK